MRVKVEADNTKKVQQKIPESLKDNPNIKLFFNIPTGNRGCVKMSFNLKNYWSKEDLLIFTSNGVVKKDGKLVMGRGIARLVRDAFPGIDAIFGKLVKSYGNRPFIVELKENLANSSPTFIMSFPTKNHWKKSSSLKLIRKSRELAVEELNKKKNYLLQKGIKRILCPLWGTENGGLPLSAVEEELKAFKKEVENIGFRVVFFSRRGIIDLNIDSSTKKKKTYKKLKR